MDKRELIDGGERSQVGTQVLASADVGKLEKENST